ncbi:MULTISPECIES: hypothetical protein [Rhodopseudomonas]|uniref:hypothetical protein n=1 Tax=Rhodopseudomonas TaxID=1073 RepID=UPI001F2D791D|nr:MULTISPECIES: hypothetical protein [Rhodopseudomonas]MDF3811162.1 hypothetical protein [Rhodopseudomonas sp. BAL398]WOK20874.1 hypothetical protein RBJ75_21910 [Rhodopseudomonas sp. BAL398]
MESERAIQRVNRGINEDQRGQRKEDGQTALTEGDPLRIHGLIHLIILFSAGDTVRANLISRMRV